MEAPTPKAGVGLVGAGVAACAVCCAAPVAGFVAAAGILTVLSVAVLGIVGLGATGIAIAVLWRRRQGNRQHCAKDPAGPVPVKISRG